MPQYIIHRDGVFNIFDTVVDAPVFSRALSKSELEEWYREQYGLHGMRELPQRIERAIVHGCSGHPPFDKLESYIEDWALVHHRAKADFVPRYLSAAD
jgi:hypothetical protein